MDPQDEVYTVLPHLQHTMDCARSPSPMLPHQLLPGRRLGPRGRLLHRLLTVDVVGFPAAMEARHASARRNKAFFLLLGGREIQPGSWRILDDRSLCLCRNPVFGPIFQNPA